MTRNHGHIANDRRFYIYGSQYMQKILPHNGTYMSTIFYNNFLIASDKFENPKYVSINEMIRAPIC